MKKSSDARKTVLQNSEEELSRCLDEKTNLMEEARNNSVANVDELVDKVKLTTSDLDKSFKAWFLLVFQFAAYQIPTLSELYF